MKTPPKVDLDEKHVQNHSTDTSMTCMYTEGENFDGMSIENWLAKQYEMGTQSTEYYKNASSVSPIPCERSRKFNGLCDTTRNGPVHIGELSITRIPSHHSILSTREEVENVNDHYEVGNSTLNVERPEITLMTNCDIFVPVLLTTTIPNDQLLIEGVKIVDTKRQTICRITGSLLFVAIVAFAATMVVTKWFPASGTLSSPSNQTLAPLGRDNASTLTITPTAAPIALGNIEWTIADALIDSSKHGDVVSLTRVASGLLFLQSTLNRTDKNFTFFRVSQSSGVIGDLDSTFISKFLSPMWNGHLLDIMRNLAVEGQVLDLGHIDNGMVVTSMAGYPLTLQLNPFRMNNINISLTSYNMYYKNGVVHTLLEYPRPLAPWVGKTMYDVLLETNSKRNGDLSDFIAIIDALPEIVVLMQDNSVTATTLFVPTNDAIALSNLTWMKRGQEYNITMIQQLVLNHIVSGNFVRSCWWTIPVGTNLSDNLLRLESGTGQSLDLLIQNDSVIINGNVTIIQQDIFAENGVIQIIDKVLLLTQ